MPNEFELFVLLELLELFFDALLDLLLLFELLLELLELLLLELLFELLELELLEPLFELLLELLLLLFFELLLLELLFELLELFELFCDAFFPAFLDELLDSLDKFDELLDEL